VQIIGLSDVAAVSAGDYHTVALKNDGTVWAWGNNQAGQLGNGYNTRKPIQAISENGINYLNLRVLSSPALLPGNPTGSGAITIADILFVRDVIFGIKEPTPAEFQAADVDSNGQINITDILGIRDIIFGI